MKNLLKNNKFGPVALAVLAAISLTSPITSYAQGEERTVVRLNIEGNAKIPEWRVDSREYTDWLNSGSPFDCGNWSPATSTIDWGDNFQQLRTCEQEQVRTVTPVLHNRILDEYKNAATYEERQSITVSQYQPNVGTRDFITGERPEPWSTWNNAGIHYECTSWSPTPDTINLYESFAQQRDCSQDQIRSRTVFDLWASGKETTNRTETEEQTIAEIESRNSTGTKDYIEGERLGNWSSWSNTGSPYSCGSWSPTANTVEEGKQFLQARSCSQDQVSERDIYNVWRSGLEELNRSESKERTASVTEARQRVGTKETDYIVNTEMENYSTPIGSKYGCEPWRVTSPGWEGRICLQDYRVERYSVTTYSSGRQTSEYISSYTYTQRQSEGRPY